jgi:opacity protein-like surface antigen
MQLKIVSASLFSAVLLVISGGKLLAQVAPAAIEGGRPIGFSVGVSDYNLDYGPGRRMQGLVARGGVDIFHGIGIDVSARTIFMNTPPQLTRMQQNTYLAGVFYEVPYIWRIRPFARFGGGLGTIEFPSGNPYYTRDSYTVFAPQGGIEYPITRKVFARAEYEYQFWKDYQSPNYLNPGGWTVGVTYYLRDRRVPTHQNY